MSAISALSSSADWVWRVAIGGEGRGVLEMLERSRDALGRYTGNGKRGRTNQAICNARVAPPADSLHTPAFVQTCREARIVILV